MRGELKIDQVKLVEASTLLELAKTTFSEAFADQNNPADFKLYMDSAFTREKITSELHNPLSEFYFATIAGSIIGYLKLNSGLAQSELQDEDGLELERIYLIEEYQGKGIGEQLLSFAIARARSLQKSYIWLGVWEKNTRAINFYERNGFSVFDKHDFLLGTDLQTDIMLRMNLESF
jgi:ribosomal protein S18 acetylase RimI-like enzyme